MLALPKRGEDAFEISYPDKDSTIVNLSDFVGMWFMWMFGLLGVGLVEWKYLTLLS